MRPFLTIIFLILFITGVAAQPCTTPGQTPSTAFPVCGTSIFHQTWVPVCATKPVYVLCNGSWTRYLDRSPYWYKFTCFQTGSLGFLIAPANLNDDYDWQLFDITGHDPNDVYIDRSIVVTGNWAGTLGNTGASASGVTFIQCASSPSQKLNAFSAMPTLVAGHTYLLLVSNFFDSQSGYNLSFNGGTAVITDPTLPVLKTAEAKCGIKIRIKLSKNIKCSSLASDGSDFEIMPASGIVSKVTGIGCSNGFDTDSIELELNSNLAPGTYRLRIKQGTDGNTLLDYCDNPMPVNDIISFTVAPQVFTPMDSLVPPKCEPQSLRLIFNRPILCSSIAKDGTDFSITGTYPVMISGVTGDCASGATASREINIQLSRPLYQKGNFTIALKTGSDGNTLLDDSTLLDEWRQQTPEGSFLKFSVADTVNADFTIQKKYGCVSDTVRPVYPAANGVNSWQWSLDDNQTSAQQYPTGLYPILGKKVISVVVSNGFCRDTSSQVVLLDNFLRADFSTIEDQCPNEPVSFVSSSQGIGLKYNWSFGDGSSSSLPSPDHVYSPPYITTSYTISCSVTDSVGCLKTAQKTIKIYSSCSPAVPNAFTPNSDGKNDFLHVLNSSKIEKLEFKVFNRWGQLVFKATDGWHGWNGTFNGIRQDTGVYVWFLTYTDRTTKGINTLKGTTILVR